jgi:ubiquinone/menaquinone biosynthesis C-methylase UbiE
MSDHYLPAMGHGPLSLYDPFTRLLRISRAHRRLLAQARIEPGMRVLEIGCGTGNLTALVKRTQPGALVTGLDPDPNALARAAGKAAKHEIHFDRGFAQRLPYVDGTFDRVLSAFMYHHVPAADRAAVLEQAQRVLAPGGSVHLVDFRHVRVEATLVERRRSLAFYALRT